MPQFKDAAGNIWSATGPDDPRPVLVQQAGAGPQMPAKPSFQFEGPQAQATLQRTQQEVQQAQATAGANTRKTTAEADKAESEAIIERQKAEDAKVQASLQKMGPTSQVHGDAYLKQFVPPDQWETVKAYARGDLGSRAGGMSASMLPIIQHAMNYDPAASGTNFAARAKMQADLAGSQPNTAGGSLRAMERMLLHGQEVLHGGAALNNFGPGILGSIGNAVRTGYEGYQHDPTLHHYNELVRNYGPEAQKAIAQTPGVGAEREDRTGAYVATLPQETRAATLQADAKQALDAMGAVNDQYKRLMGHDIVSALNPAAKRAYDEIMAGGYDKQGHPLHPADGWTPLGGTGSPGNDGGVGGDGTSPSDTSPPGLPPANTPGGNDPTPPVPASGGGIQPIDHPKARSMIASMLNAGAGYSTINAALKAQNLPPLKFNEFSRVKTWMDANPGKQYPASSVNASTYEALNPLQRAAGSGAGAFAAQMGNSALAGLPAYAMGDKAQGALDAMGALHPTAAMLGSMAGGLESAAGGELGAAGLAGKFLPSAAKYAPRIADAAYGGLSGYTGSDGNLGTAALDAIVAPIAGKAGEKAVGALAGAAKGVTDPAVQYLRGLNIPLTVGQTVGNGGWLGKGVKKVEDALTSMPGVGNMVDARRKAGLEAFNKAAFEIGAQTTGNEVQDYGASGLRKLAQLKTDAYSNALDPVTIDIAGSPQATNDITNAGLVAAGIPKVGQDAVDALNYHIGEGVMPDGTMAGRDFQEAYRGLGRAGRKAAPGDYGHEVSGATRMGQDALASALEDQNPGAFQGFLDANAANRRLNILANALGTAKNQERGMFTPAQLNNADFGNAANLTGKVAAASGDRPFAGLADAGQAVLPSKLPDSGTATRAMILHGLSGLGLGAAAGGGAGYLGGETGTGAETGLGTAALLMALGTKGGQRMLTKTLADRPDWLRTAGTGLENYAPHAGIISTPAGLALLNALNGQ